MLLLSRRVNEVIVIKLPDGRDVKVRVNKLRGNIVQLGITAARDINVFREELLWEVPRVDSPV